MEPKLPMNELFLEATLQHDCRSILDSRIQPWKTWWPSSIFLSSSYTDVNLLSNPGPWDSWKYRGDLFDKPWVQWPMRWPHKYEDYAQRETSRIPETHGATRDRQLVKQAFDPFMGLSLPRVHAYLQFTVPIQGHENEKPYVCRIPPPRVDLPQMNFIGQLHLVTIADISGYEDQFTLDRHGFQFVGNAFCGHVNNSTKELREYMQHMSAWLKAYLRCTEVVVFDYAFRSEQKQAGIGEISRRVHCDQTPRSAIGRIKLHMGPRAEELLQKRCRLINIWRPTISLVESHPLAMCAFSTMKPEDLIPVDVVFPHWAEEAYEARPSSSQSWYYRSSMTDRDVMLLKVYDNKPDTDVAFAVAHSAFNDPTVRADAPPRASLELRCLVFGEEGDNA